MSQNKMKKGAKKPFASKLQQKHNQKFKKIQEKYYDKVEDYFPRDGDNDGMGFNKAPVLKEYTPGKGKTLGKRSRSKGLSGNLGDKGLYREYESDDEDLEVTKKTKSDLDFGTGDDFEEGLLGTSKGFADYFADKKNAFKNLTKMSNFNYNEGSLVLASVCDKGPNDKYLVVNLPRNKKGYISFSDITRSNENHVNKFKVGEYVLCTTLSSNPKKVQFSIKPEAINRDLRSHNIYPNQIVSGYLRDKEDYGYTVDFCTEDRATGFLYFPEVDGLELVLDKPYLFIINGRNESTSVLDCQIIHPNLVFGTETLNYNQITNNGEDSGLDLHRLVDAGNLVHAIVKKKLENGLLVNFLGLFYGFIFQDHMSKPLSQYKLNEKLVARIIATDFESKQIHLSDLDPHVNLTIYKPEVTIGTKFTSVLVKEELYGGSYLLEIGERTLKKKNKGDTDNEVIKGFLHNIHVVTNEEDEEAKEEHRLQAGAALDKPVYVKDYNYFEHYVVVTMKEEVLSSLKTSWTNLKAGDIVKGVVSKIVEGGPQVVKVIVKLNEGVTGVLSYSHLSDVTSKSALKLIKENKEIKVRVLSIDNENKKLFLTMKPSLLKKDVVALSDYFDVQLGTQYTGVITGSSEKGYVIKFFNDVKGFLPFQDIENNGSKKEEFSLGEVIKVYVKFVDTAAQKMGLTLSSEVTKNLKTKENKWGNIQNQNEKIKNASESGISEGDVYEYTILRKKSAVNEDFLFAKSTKGVILEKGKFIPHIAILPKTHFSDFEVHNERIFELYKLKEITFQGKVLGFLPNNNILITQKPSLVRQALPKSFNDLVEKQSYYGYVETCIQSGVRVKLSEHVKGILSSTKLPEGIQEDFSGHFPSDKTLQVVVTKINKDENKLYFDLTKPNKETFSAEEDRAFFLDFLNEEFMLTNDEVAKDTKIWKNYKVGNYVKGTIKMVKNYGVIIKLNDKLAGVILKSNLLKPVEQYKTEQQLICRVLDVDYEKNVVDLSEETVSVEKFEQKYKKRTNFNVDKIHKYKLFKHKSEILSANVLLVKDLYIVGKLVKHPKVIVLIQCKKFNDFYLSHEVYQKDSIIKFKSLNLHAFDPENVMNNNDIDSLKKASNALAGEIFVVRKKDGEEEGGKADVQVKKKLKEGQRVTGTVTKISSNNVFVSLEKTMFGRIHKTQFDFDSTTNQSNFDNYKIGDEIPCRILSVKKGSHVYIDLTARKEFVGTMEEETEANFSDLIVDTVDESHKGKKQYAVIKSVSAKSVNPLYFELSNAIFAHAGLFGGLVNPHTTKINDQFDKITKVEEYYKPGDVIEVWVKDIHKRRGQQAQDKNVQYSVEVTLYDPSVNAPTSQNQVGLGGANKNVQHKIGDLVVCRIMKVLPKGVHVQFGRNEFGFVDITELFDEFYAYPLKQIESKVNTVMMGRIIAITVNEGSGKSKKSETYISLRETVINPVNWKVLSPEGTTIQFKNKLGYQEERGDLRSRVYKLGPSAIKENMIFVGYVNETNDKGCFVKLAFNLSARASHKELADLELQNPSSTFFKNKLVIGRILSKREDGKFDATLKEHGVKFGYQLEDTRLKPGLLVKGVVTGHFKNAAVLSIPGCQYVGVLRSDEVNTEGKTMDKAFPIGTSVLTKVKQIEKSGGGSQQLKLTCRINEDELNDKSKVFNLMDDERPKEADKVALLYDSIQEICKEYQTLGHQSNINTDLVENFEAQNAEQEENEEQEEEGDQGNEMNIEEEDDDEEEEKAEKNTRMMIEFGQDDDLEEENEYDENEILEEQSVISDEENGENAEFILSNKSTGKKKKEIQKMKMEAEIRERERQLLNENEKELKTSDDYEKLLLKNPNSSYIWIQYVAFKFQKDGIQKARQLMERAIRNVMFRNENEKLNLWTASINLEYNFGTEESLMKVFERAKQANNPKKVFMKLIELYRRDGKWEHVEELSKAMIKKHKNSSKAWISHLEHMLEVMKAKGVENLDLSSIISRALQSLPKRKHLKLLPQHGILLYKNGYQEKGRTVFEAIVSNYPKRTDIWSIYLDMETKFGDKESFRNLMERCLTLSLNPKKIKFFFKRYLTYESKFGTADRVEYVRQKALEYVQSQVGKDQGDENEEEQEVEEEENNDAIEEEEINE